MQFKNKQFSILILTLFIALGVMIRLLPHAPNFAPIAAIALFGAAYLPKRIALFLPLGAMFVSDLFLPAYSFPIRISVYASFLFIGLIGLVLRRKVSPARLLASSLTASIVFYLITNTAVWFFGTMYPHSLGGLFMSYYSALPFFRNTLLGDLFYSAVFFGSFEFFRYFAFRKKSLFATETINQG